MVTAKTVGKHPELFPFPFLPIFPVFIPVPVVFAEMVYGRFIRDSELVGTGFSHPVFNPGGEIKICKIHKDLNISDPLTKPLPQPKHERHTRAMGIRYILD